MRDHLADLASDFSAVHGIRDMLSLPGPVFFAFAYRLSAYQGVMAARVQGSRDPKSCQLSVISCQ